MRTQKSRGRVGLIAGLVFLMGVGALAAPDAGRLSLEAPPLVVEYLERWFEFFPSRATAAGWHARDAELEDLSAERLAAWVEFNRRTVERSEAALAGDDLSLDDRLDLGLLAARARRVVFDYDVLDRPGRYPLYWSGLLSNATVLLLVREDVPREERLAAVVSRARQIPRLAAQAREALAAGDRARIAPEHAAMAARQAKSSARFYREGFERAGDESHRERLAAAGLEAAAALEELAVFLEELAATAEGSPRLGADYAESFRLKTGVETPVAKVLERAELALAAKRRETAAYGRGVWERYFPDRAVPLADRDVVAALFDRVAADRAGDVDEFVEDYRRLIAASLDFVRERDLMTLPEPLTLWTGRSPSYFIGQSVGGVYSAGPFAPEGAETLLFLPTPPSSATPEQRDGFFRDFNHHFNTMITPHEVIPGHYLQLKMAARHPRKARALLGDGVYIEGWGTFCERLMLDLGWGDPLARLAHLKKQLENIARTIIDIRVHTEEMSREEVIRFVRDEALQDAQFAANMWRRAITSSPQLTYYFLGYDQVWGHYEETQRLLGEDFDLKTFLDGMMAMGPVPVAEYRKRR